MTSRFFSFGTVPQNPTKDQIQTYAMSGDLNKLKTAVINANLQYHDIIDKYDNTLLHLATLSRQHDVIEFLLSTSIDKTRLNYFKQTAYDIAISQQDKKTLKLFTDHTQNQMLKDIDLLRYENKRLRSLSDDNELLRSKNSSLYDSNLVLNGQVMSLTDETSQLKKSIDILHDRNKRLRCENDELITQNKKLKISIDNLIELQKKR